MIRTESAAIAVYTPAQVMSGLLSRAILTWKGPNAQQTAQSIRSWLETQTNGAAEGGVTIQRDAIAIDGVRGDVWSTKPHGTARGLQMFLGAAQSMTGYLVASDTRGYFTTGGTDKQFLTSVLKPKQPLSGNIILSQIADLLPSDRSGEVYVEPGPILALFTPMLAMVTGGKPIELPAGLPPIGGALALSDGALHMSVFVPAPVLRLGYDLSKGLGALGAERR